MDVIEQKFRQYFKPYELVSYAHYMHLKGDADLIYSLFTDELKEVAVYLRESFNAFFTVNYWYKYIDRLELKPTKTAVKELEAELEVELGYKVDILEFRGFRWDDCKIGATHSAHRKGEGLDVTIKGYTALRSRNLTRDRFMKGLPHPIRIEKNVNWFHFDVCNLTNKKIQYFKG